MKPNILGDGKDEAKDEAKHDSIGSASEVNPAPVSAADRPTETGATVARRDTSEEEQDLEEDRQRGVPEEKAAGAEGVRRLVAEDNTKMRIAVWAALCGLGGAAVSAAGAVLGLIVLKEAGVGDLPDRGPLAGGAAVAGLVAAVPLFILIYGWAKKQPLPLDKALDECREGSKFALGSIFAGTALITAATTVAGAVMDEDPAKAAAAGSVGGALLESAMAVTVGATAGVSALVSWCRRR
ncbi:MAG TPA: hypothetical protein VJB02_03415 [Coxiellaceae bacterium]|nr:hypothetical protein [Coxiellaceae bacterium]